MVAGGETDPKATPAAADAKLRRWAIETACRFLQPGTSLADAVLACQVADLLVAYVLTGRCVPDDTPSKGTRLM